MDFFGCRVNFGVWAEAHALPLFRMVNLCGRYASHNKKRTNKHLLHAVFVLHKGDVHCLKL